MGVIVNQLDWTWTWTHAHFIQERKVQMNNFSETKYVPVRTEMLVLFIVE